MEGSFGQTRTAGLISSSVVPTKALIHVALIFSATLCCTCITDRDRLEANMPSFNNKTNKGSKIYHLVTWAAF